MSPVPISGMGAGMTAGLALLCALVAGLGGRTVRGGLYAGLVLALSLPLLLPGDGPESPGDGAAADVFSPVRATGLLLPDLWEPIPAGVPNLVVQAFDADALSLRAQGLTHGDAERPSAGRARLHVGITALCLAFMALVGVRGVAAWIGRVLLVAGLAMVWGSPGTSASATVSLLDSGLVTTGFALALMAGLALGSLKPLGEQDPVAAALFLGTVAVIVFGGLAGWAAWTGSAEPRDVVAPLVERLASQGAPPPTTLARDATAAHLVRVLDHGALAALAAMTALLLHLKGRRLPTAVLVFLVTAGELLVVQFGWPFG